MSNDIFLIKNKKINIIKALLVLSIILLVISACQNPLNKLQPENHTEETGYFSLLIDEQNAARTILPITVQSDFAAYKLEFFTSGSATTPVVTVDRTNVNLADPIPLNAGTWDLYVTAYMDTSLTKSAAIGHLMQIEISPGKTVNGNVELRPIIENGEGTFSWNINYPINVIVASMTIKPLDLLNGTPELTQYFVGETPTIAKASAITLKTGYYRVTFCMTNNIGMSTERREILHIYQNMESVFTYSFIDSQFANTIIVTNGTDSGAGSLRQAINDVPTGGTVVVDSNVGTIALTGRLPDITKNIKIIGNGVVITRDISWTTSVSNTQLMYIGNTGTATISSVHFKDGRATTYGAAIYNQGGNLTLESCVFSGSRTTSSSAYGGAIYSTGTSIIKGCTFYGNSTEYRGGVIYQSGGTLTLIGNIFYDNTATNAFPVVCRAAGATVTTNGYNVVDVTLGTGTNQSGWVGELTDKNINSMPISLASFRLLPGSGAANIISTLPNDYPSEDFYGDPIINGAAAGAVQNTAIGYCLDLSLNNNTMGNVSVTPEPNSEGLYEDTITVTATPFEGKELLYWLINEEKIFNTRHLILHLTDNVTIHAVFGFLVNNFTDETGSATTPGTLRYALTNVIEGDIIRLSGVTPGVTTIRLINRLPDIVVESILIEGNGVTLTSDVSWTSTSTNSHLMYIGNTGTVTISRVHFKEGRVLIYGAGINNQGNLTLESCIFSGNMTIYNTALGGAINNFGTISIKGCTFYGNRADRGGAIYNYGTLILSGNLFYGNIASNISPVVYGSTSGIVTSNGYNVVDVALGTGTNQSGWTGNVTDKNTIDLPVSPVSFRLLSGSSAANVISALPINYPAEDFYGDPIISGAAAGAIQSTAIGYYLDLSFNNNKGSVSVTPEPNSEGLYEGTITLVAAPNESRDLLHWLLNGEKVFNTTQLILHLTDNVKIQAVFGYLVTNFSDETGSATTPGTLRYALTNVLEEDVIRLSGVTPGVTTIGLIERLPYIFGKTILIEGNGVTITRDASWTTESSSSQLMHISGTANVTISRVHFKDGRAQGSGAGINNMGNLTLESCIFSGNRATSSSAYGGAIYNSGTLSIKGCTFYGNSTEYRGGAIFNSGTLILSGNLFYGNTAANIAPVVYRLALTITSNGYNVVDVALGIGANESGWNRNITDKSITDIPISPVSFRLLSGSGAANVISALPNDYPSEDFYGDPIIDGAAAGAVQSKVATGYYVDLSLHNNKGNVSVTPEPNSEGLYEDKITLAAISVEGMELEYWMLNGEKIFNTKQLILDLTDNMKILAVFGYLVANFSDETGSATTPGTLRYALTNVMEGDIIRLSGVTPGVTTIALSGRLPDIVAKNILIEGNGVTLTCDAYWATENDTSQLMYVGYTGTVTISRFYFKDGRVQSPGGAIYNTGNLTLESCIFSGNQATSGGAIYNSGTISIKGCTFNGNNAGSGGTIYNNGTLILIGNLFYSNTATNAYPVVYRAVGSTTTTNGYNVVDVELGGLNTNYSGWAAHSTDRTLLQLLGSNTTSPFVNTTNFTPVSELRSFIPSTPADFPTTDFLGNLRTYPGAPGAVR